MEVPSSENESGTSRLPNPVKLITVSNGKAHIDIQKLEILFDGLVTSEKDYKVACICIIGEKGSGKSFLTNMILQNLIVEGEGNWIGPVTKGKDRLEGFSWKQRNSNDEISSISMMPRPFLLKRCNGEEILLLVMDFFIKPSDAGSQVLLEALVWLLCPTVVVNQLHNIDLDLIKIRKKVMDSHGTPFSPQLFFALRDYSISDKLLSYGKSNDQRLNKYVKSFLTSSNRVDLLPLWDSLENKCGFALSPPGNPSIVDNDGHLTLQTSFISHVKKFVTDILDVDDMPCYSDEKGRIVEYFRNSVAWVNEKFGLAVLEEDLKHIEAKLSSTGLEDPAISEDSKNSTLIEDNSDIHTKCATTEKESNILSRSTLDENLHHNFKDKEINHYTKNISFDGDDIVENVNNFSEVLLVNLDDVPVGSKSGGNEKMIPDILPSKELATNEALIAFEGDVKSNEKQKIPKSGEAFDSKQEHDATNIEEFQNTTTNSEITNQPTGFPVLHSNEQSLIAANLIDFEDGVNTTKEDSIIDSPKLSQRTESIQAESFSKSSMEVIQETIQFSKSEDENKEKEINPDSIQIQPPILQIPHFSDTTALSGSRNSVEYSARVLKPEVKTAVEKNKEKFKSNANQSGPTAEEKQMMDQKIQTSITTITESYLKSMNEYKTGSSLSKVTLPNKHAMLIKVATDKLQTTFNELKLNDDDRQEKENILRNSLKCHYHKILKGVERSIEKGNEGKSSKGAVKTLPNSISNVKKTESSNKIEYVKGKQSAETVTGASKCVNKMKNDIEPETIANQGNPSGWPKEKRDSVGEIDIENQREVAFKEREDKLLAQYVYTISSFIQTNNPDENCLTEFHISESLKLTTQLSNMFGDMNNFESKLTAFQNKLADELLKWPSPADEVTQHSPNVPQYSEECVKRILWDHKVKLMFTIYNATVFVQDQYDHHMERSVNAVTSVAQLHFAHNRFTTFLTDLTFWNDFEGDVEVFQNLLGPDYFSMVFARGLKRYEDRLKHKSIIDFYSARERKMLSTLNKFCLQSYTREIYKAVSIKINDIGFSFIMDLIEDVHKSLISKIVQDCCLDEASFQSMLEQLSNDTQQELQEIQKLDSVLKVYKEEMGKKFKKEICLSEKLLNDCHAAAMEISKKYASSFVSNKSFIDVAEVAINFAKSWYINGNNEIQKFEKEAAESAIGTVLDFYRREMNSILGEKLHRTEELTNKHNELKRECIETFRKSIPFYCDPEKSGLEDFSAVLEKKMEDSLEGHLETNEKNMEQTVSALKKIVIACRKNFKEMINTKLSVKAFDPLEFETLYEEIKADISKQLKDALASKIPTEEEDLHLKNLECEMEADVKQMRESNKSKREEELIRLRRERQDLLKDEANRGCTLPYLCIEFNGARIQAGFTGKDGKLTNVVDQFGNANLENTISFLNQDEFLFGTVPHAKIKDIVESINIGELLLPSSGSLENVSRPKQLSFRGEIFEINLEFACSIVFATIMELAEKQSKEKFATAVISIPLWFASRHRQVIKDAAFIAGFEEVFLMNDTSAAALTHFTSDNKSKARKPNCLVVAAGKDYCNAAVYSYSKEKIQMVASHGNRHIKCKSYWKRIFNHVWYFSGSPAEDSDIYSLVIKEVKCDPKSIDAIMLFQQNSPEIIDSCKKALASKAVKNIIISDPAHEESMVMKGIQKFSQSLENNIKSAKESIIDAIQYKFVSTEGVQDYSKPLMHKGQKYGMEIKNKHNTGYSVQKTVSFYEEASDLSRFHYGTAKYTTKKNKGVEMNISVSREGIYEVEVAVDSCLINIDSYAITEEQRSKYSTIMEKHFKRDPALDQLQQAKMVLKELAEDMEKRFHQVNVKTEFLKEHIKKDIESAIKLTESPAGDLQTVEAKTKTLEAIREKRFPKM